MDRRTFVGLAGGSLLAGVLQGCAKGIVRPPICPHYASTSPINVIDVHCHVFNATDLQVGDFLSRVVASSGSDSPIGIIGSFVQSLGWNFAPTASEELRWLETRRRDPVLSMESSAVDGYKGPVDGVSLKYIKTDSHDRFQSFFTEFQTRHPEEFQRFAISYVENASVFAAKRVRDRQSRQIAPLIANKAELAARLKQPQALDLLIANESSGGAPPILSFVKSFFRFRTENAWLALQMYGCDSDPAVDLLTPAMVDFDLWLGNPREDRGRTKSHIDEQLDLAQAVARATNGRVHMFAPFNPLRAACDSSYVELCHSAITEKGCVGFKLYPPMGFAPWGNEKIYPSKTLVCPERTVSGRDLDDALGELYEFCAHISVPIMAHSSPSNGPNEDSKLRGSPAAWERAIEQHPTLFSEDGKKIRLSFAHFGGDHDATSEPGGQWTREFAEVIKKHSFTYADMSYYARLLEGPEYREAVAKAMGPFLSTDPLSSRIMYGSDWTMLGMKSGYQSYLQSFSEFLDSDSDIGAVRKAQILGGNAKSFLGLNVGDSGRDRLEKFHRRHGQAWKIS
jgi:predicted TIM-barrel fold metal-dependent hydrolase